MYRGDSKDNWCLSQMQKGSFTRQCGRDVSSRTSGLFIILYLHSYFENASNEGIGESARYKCTRTL